MKTCSTCKKECELSNFYKNGLAYQCKQCAKEYSKKRIKIQRRIKFTYEWYKNRYNTKKHHVIKKRHINFNLSFKEWLFLVKQTNCFYCKRETKPITIDRINNKIGYTKKNCKPSCFRCNYLKSYLFSFEEMIQLGKVLAKIDKKRAVNKLPPMYSYWEKKYMV